MNSYGVFGRRRSVVVGRSPGRLCPPHNGTPHRTRNGSSHLREHGPKYWPQLELPLRQRQRAASMCNNGPSTRIRTDRQTEM